MIGILIGIFLFLLTFPIKAAILAMKAALAGSKFAIKVTGKTIEGGSRALARAGIGNDEAGRVVRTIHGTGVVAGGAARLAAKPVKAGVATVGVAGKVAKHTKAGKAVSRRITKLKNKIKSKKAVKNIFRGIKIAKSALHMIKLSIVILLVSYGFMLVIMALSSYILLGAVSGVLVLATSEGGIQFSGGTYSIASNAESSDSSVSSGSTGLDSWLKHSDEMWWWYTENIKGYSTGTKDNPYLYWEHCPYIDENVGACCTWFMAACLAYEFNVSYSEAKSGISSTHDFADDMREYMKTGSTDGLSSGEKLVLEHFNVYKMKDITEIKPGDMVLNGDSNGVHHMEMCYDVVDGQIIRQSWGQSYYGDTEKPTTSESSYLSKYEFLFRLK